MQPLMGGFAMARFVDRTGQKFGKLTVLYHAGKNKLNKILWQCRCDCGNELPIVAGSLVTGNTKTCGCVKPNFKHGGSKKYSYNTWRAMMRRCNVPTDKDYLKYGARNIKVAEEWHDYQKFVADMGEPQGSQTLDRINPYGDYSKDNCRWASVAVQARNTRVRPNTKSGYTGVHFRSGKWYAEITYQKRKYYSKACLSIPEAAAARKELERIYWGHE